MNRSRLVHIAWFVVLLAFLLQISPDVAAKAGRDYGESIRALQKKDWKKAEEKIRKALSDVDRAQESILISGSTRYPYLPYYVLGTALHGQGNCQLAVEAWRESLSQGVVQKSSKEYQSLQSGMTACAGQVAESSPASVPPVEPPSPSQQDLQAAEIARRAQEATRSLGDLERTIASYSKLSKDPYLSSEWRRDWKPALDAAKQELRQLGSDIERARDGGDIARLKSIAAQIQQVFSKISTKRIVAQERIVVLEQQRVAQTAERSKERKRQEALDEQRRLAALQEREEADRRKRELEASEQVATAQRQLRQELNRIAPSLRETNGDGRVIGARRQLAALSTASEALMTSNSVANINKQTQSARDGLRRYNQTIQEWEGEQRDIALRTPPPKLREIADAYFAGDYEKAIRMAQPKQFADIRQKVQAYLFRSAARYNMYWLTGATDEKLKQEAKKDIAEIKRLDSDFVPYVAAFSPKFLDFFGDA